MAVLTTENIEIHIEPIVRQIVRDETNDMRTDIGDLKEDVFELKGDVAVLKTEVVLLKEEVSSLGVQFEAFDHKMDAIAELVTTTVATRKAGITNTQRIEVLEQAVSVMRAKYA